MFRAVVWGGLFVVGVTFAEPGQDPLQPAQPLEAKDLSALAQEVGNDLKAKLPNLRQDQSRRLQRELFEMKRILDEVLRARPFKYTLNEQELKVYNQEGKLLQTWNHHQTMEIRGEVMALLDSGKEFMALKSDGTVLVSQWRDTVAFYLFDDYVGLLDSKGIFETFSTREKKPLIKDWADTISVVAQPYYTALLDKNGILEGYTVDGTQVLKVKGVKSVRGLDYRSIEYVTQDGQTLSFQIVQ